MKLTPARARVIGALLSFPSGDILAADVVARADLPSGTAYPILNTLVDQGYLMAIIPDGSARKTTYRLDEAGRRTLKQYMNEFILATTGMRFRPASPDLQIREPRELVGRHVRQVWVEWAREQSEAKPSWLLPWEELDEGQREVDMRIGDALFEAGKRAGYEYGQADARAEIAADDEAISALNAVVTKLERRAAGWRSKAQASERELAEYRRRFGPLSEEGSGGSS